MKKYVIKLGDPKYGYYQKHVGDGWLETTLLKSEAFSFDLKIAKEMLSWLNRNIQFRYCRFDQKNEIEEI